MKIRNKVVAGVLGLSALSVSLGIAQAKEVSVGVVVSTTGPGAVLGIPYRNVFASLPKQISGASVNYVVLNDESDITTGVKNAKKLIDELKVDVLIGSNSVPVTKALMGVAAEAKVPLLSLGPIELDAVQHPWTFSIPQPIPLMMGAVLQNMQEQGIKKVGYIGFSDAWGDSVYGALTQQNRVENLQVTTNERYQRNDVSVVAQALKVISTRPDAVVIGASGAPSALPHIALREKGFKGVIYHTHGSVSEDFIRIGGASVEGALAPAGPFLFAEYLSDDNVIKSTASEYLNLYDAAYGKEARSPFAGYAYDAYLLLKAVLPVVSEQAEPGTETFRVALRDALEGSVQEVVGTQGVYTMTPTEHNGLDDRARILVKVKDKQWLLN